MKTQIIQRAFDHLEPGGWLECQEVNVLPTCDDGTMPEDFGWRKWAREMVRASDLTNRQLDLGEHVKTWLHEVGFVDIHEAVIKIPIGSWPKDKRLKHLGMLWQQNLLTGLHGFTMALAHNVLGKPIDEIEVRVCAMGRYFASRTSRPYHSVRVAHLRFRLRSRWLKPDRALSTRKSTVTIAFTWSGDEKRNSFLSSMSGE